MAKEHWGLGVVSSLNIQGRSWLCGYNQGSATSEQQSSNLIRNESKQQVMEAQLLAAKEETFWLKAEKKPSLYIHTCTCKEQSQDPF